MANVQTYYVDRWVSGHMTGSGYRDQVAKYIGYTGGYYGLLAKDKSRRKILLFGHTLLVGHKALYKKVTI